MSELLPLPPPRLLPHKTRWIRTLRAGTFIGRVFATGGDYPTTWNTFRRWGSTQSRFDHHVPPPREHAKRGILYAAVDGVEDRATGHAYPILQTALAEYYQGTRLVSPAETHDYYALMQTVRPFLLLDLGDTDWLSAVGGNAAIYAGARAAAREWSQAIYAAYRDIDGLIYPSSIATPGRAIALWERARTAIPDSPTLNHPLDHPDLSGAVAAATDRIGYGLAWQTPPLPGTP